jgi:superfamily II DNA or RNA helicase/HKD family nuclease
VGAYDELIDGAVAELVEVAQTAHDVDALPLEPAEAPRYLAHHVERLLRRALSTIAGDSPEAHQERVQLVNRVLDSLATAVAGTQDLFAAGETTVIDPPQRLLGVRLHDSLAIAGPWERPETPLSQSALLVNAPNEPALGSELRRELATTDNVELLCAFLRWSGLRLVQDRLADVIRRGGRVRVITTTYLGATEIRAIDALIELGAEVRISFDTRRTRLHAKAWLFQRNTGAHTAYIGSSNLSHSALHEGLEWNVRLAEADAAPLLDKFRAAFESYWSSSEFVPYDPGRDRTRLRDLLTAEHGAAPSDALTAFEVRPHPYQEQMLEALRVERERGHWRNLVVAPTGTGKTLVAAFDYQRLRAALPSDRLLFVAHRDRILEQSRRVFRLVLGESAFGELYSGGERPERGDHIFATIQSLARIDLAALDPERFDAVIVDEFHHAEAATYERLLAHLRPRLLLGLTATPERHDGRDVRRWFDGRTAYEMRLWDALEQGLLSPFQYFGVNDETDLSAVTWRRAGYDVAALENLYTSNDARVRLVLKEVQRRVVEPRRMRALGFCVSVAHAEFMARRFTEAGIAAAAVTGETPRDERNQAVDRLQRGDLQVLFTVDLFNEGVDIPQVDTVLFLRPTESATVFLQQLGRGLRLHREKPCLTALDFIGNARREFRFDRRFRALLGGATRRAVQQIEASFPYLPAGCAMQLDSVAAKHILENIRQGIGTGKRWLTEELRALGPGTSLADFVRETELELADLYVSRRSFASLRCDAFGTPSLDDAGRHLQSRLGALLHVNDAERLSTLRTFSRAQESPRVAQLEERQRRLLFMLACALDVRTSWDSLDAALETLWQNATLRAELAELVDLLDDRRRDATFRWERAAAAPLVPLHVHGQYRQEEVLAAFREVRNGLVPRLQSGVFYAEAENLGGQVKTGHTWTGQNRPKGRRRGLSFISASPPVVASPIAVASASFVART